MFLDCMNLEIVTTAQYCPNVTPRLKTSAGLVLGRFMNPQRQTPGSMSHHSAAEGSTRVTVPVEASQLRLYRPLFLNGAASGDVGEWLKPAVC
jgi:hypothetical protein